MVGACLSTNVYKQPYTICRTVAAYRYIQYKVYSNNNFLPTVLACGRTRERRRACVARSRIMTLRARAVLLVRFRRRRCCRRRRQFKAICSETWYGNGMQNNPHTTHDPLVCTCQSPPHFRSSPVSLFFYSPDACRNLLKCEHEVLVLCAE